MKEKRKSYYNQQWFDFAKIVRHRDNNECLRCHRKEPEVILQVHHLLYKAGLEPWEYPYSDCQTLCKGCHARAHNLVEPDSGWTLIAIDDRGSNDGICERSGCGNEIRYEHVIYFPGWGYKSVGSSCVDLLTKEDQFLSKEVVKVFRKVSQFIDTSHWEIKFTQARKPYHCAIHAHHQIRIYGSENNYGFQIAQKIPGVKRFNFREFFWFKNKNLVQVKELAFIALKGLTAESEEERIMLRNIYKRIK